MNVINYTFIWKSPSVLFFKMLNLNRSRHKEPQTIKRSQTLWEILPPQHSHGRRQTHTEGLSCQIASNFARNFSKKAVELLKLILGKAQLAH